MKRILYFLLPLLLTACASPFEMQYSQYVSPKESLTLVKHKTTSRQVRALLGVPNVVTPDSQDDKVWIYQRKAKIASVRQPNAFARLTVPGKHDKTLTFFFDSKDNTLKGFRGEAAQQ